MKEDVSKEISELITDIEKRQRHSFIRTLTGFVFVCAIAGVIVFLSYKAVSRNLREVQMLKKEYSNIQEKAKTLQNEVDRANKEKESLQAEVEYLGNQLSMATQFAKYEFEGDLAMALKRLASTYQYQRQFLFLHDILEMQKMNIGWKLDGRSPQEGFDSPSFAAFMLEKHGLLDRPAFEVSSSSRLREIIPPTASPEVGDIVFYSLGYTMFYFLDERGRPYVIGMTPLGIIALKKDFAPIIGYGKINY
jgi:FtsZ-binding cell division protein ZapB